MKAVEWLRSCREFPKLLGVNPPFPPAKSINANEAESKDVRLMIKLIESGIHEQNNRGEQIEMWGEGATEKPVVGKKGLTINWTESFRKINFFGVEIPFGPLMHTWTEMELVSAYPLTEIRDHMTFKGGRKSMWRIEYKRPS